MQERIYDAQSVEAKWQEYWKKNDTFAVDLDDHSKPKFYMLSMYPYPSGALHTGHVMEYTIGDLIARYRRMRGFNVLYPMGWDSFGLPAENAAIRENIAPADFTYGNIDKMRAQMDRAGWSCHWPSEIATSHPGYYQWNQWIFLQMFKKGLAYKKDSAVNWCPMCMTVLANEQVVDGKCERHGCDVNLRQLEQWYLRITDYSQRMLDEVVPGWDSKVVAMQKEWIGRSEGARIDFKLEHNGEILPVFTTRPDTLFGVTFMSIAAEHPLVNTLCAGTEQEAAVKEFVQRMSRQASFERGAEGAPKEGVFTGRHVINPVNGDRVPLWVSSYVLMEYGTGAVMAVPAHDQRDFDFARKYDLPVKVVIHPVDGTLDASTMEEAYVEDGVQVNSGPFDGQPNREGMSRIIRWLEEKNYGGATINYRQKDWLISRQRYWGTPIPIIYCDDCGTVPVPEEQLPVRLPDNVDFRPTGKSPLASVDSFVNTTCPKCSKPARRETDTMDTFIDSSWYYFRYLSPRDETRVFDSQRVQHWLPIDQYVGGIEHANGHLVFSRFFTKFLKDAGIQPWDEYATNLFTHGMVCMVAHYCSTCSWVHRDHVANGKCTKCGTEVRSELTKMSKTKLNTISPDTLFAEYGADALRLYIVFMGPPDKSTEYNDNGLIGAFRFLKRVYEYAARVSEELPGIAPYQGDGSALDKENRALRTKMHQVIAKVTQNNETFAFNTGVAAIMELYNTLKATETAIPALRRSVTETIVQLLYPMTPHVCEEIWEMLGHPPSLQNVAWPEFDEAAAQADEIEVVFQVNGKVRGKEMMPADSSDDALKAAALANPGVERQLDGKPPRKVIVVKGRLVNVVA